MNEKDDFEIIKCIQAGEHELYALLVERYHRKLLGFIHGLLGDDRVVEDIGQEVFFSVYKSLDRFEPGRETPFSAWLFISARNRCISELRRQGRRGRIVEEVDSLPASDRSPEQSAIERERLEALRAALAQLPEPFQSTILDSLKGDNLETIALHQGVSTGTVKSRLSRARSKLRALLTGKNGGTHEEF